MTSVNPICTLKTNIRPTDGPTDTVAYNSKTEKTLLFYLKGGNGTSSNKHRYKVVKKVSSDIFSIINTNYNIFFLQ